MLCKRYNWVLLFWTWNIRVNCDPGAGEDCGKTTPHDVPNCPTMGEVGAMICGQRAVANSWDRAGVD